MRKNLWWENQTSRFGITMHYNFGNIRQLDISLEAEETEQLAAKTD